MLGYEITTPPKITKSIGEFCRTIVPGGNPVYVDVAPYDGCEVRDCHRNCERFLKTNAGETLRGWLIWTIPDQWIEAEQHSVIRLPDGVLRDVTPQPDGEERIVFLHDPHMVYDGTILPKRTRVLADTPAIQQLKKIAEYETSMVSGRRDTLESLRTSTPEQRTRLRAEALSLLGEPGPEKRRITAGRRREKQRRREKKRRQRANKRRK